jgi:2'-5' RNA ligase
VLILSLVRAFIAIDIDERIIDELVKVQEAMASMNLDIKFVERENIHLTLKFLGEITADRVNGVCDVMRGLKASPFTLEVKGLGAFPSVTRPRVVWAGVGDGGSNVIEIYRFLDSGLRKLNFKSEGEEFTPHITLGRLRSDRNVRSLSSFLMNYGERVFGSFIVTSVRLKKSVLTPRGPIYSNLYEIKLV